jgi:hypothetical protein
LAFTRNKSYWSIVSDSWGFTVGPYAAIGTFALLILMWLTRARMREHRWTWQIRPLDKVDLVRGVAPKTVPLPVDTNVWKRGMKQFLEYL